VISLSLQTTICNTSYFSTINTAHPIGENEHEIIHY